MSQHAQLREKTQQLSSRSNWASRQRLEEEQKSHLEADDNFPLQPLPFLPVGVIIDTKHTKSLKKRWHRRHVDLAGWVRMNLWASTRLTPVPSLSCPVIATSSKCTHTKADWYHWSEIQRIPYKPNQNRWSFSSNMGEGGLVGYFLAHWGYNWPWKDIKKCSKFRVNLSHESACRHEDIVC